MSQNKQVGMINIREKKNERFAENSSKVSLDVPSQLVPSAPQGACWDSASQGSSRNSISGHFTDICA